jgi:hypothetical protein
MREFKTTIREVPFCLLHGFREVGANFMFFGEAELVKLWVFGYNFLKRSQI